MLNMHCKSKVNNFKITLKFDLNIEVGLTFLTNHSTKALRSHS